MLNASLQLHAISMSVSCGEWREIIGKLGATSALSIRSHIIHHLPLWQQSFFSHTEQLCTTCHAEHPWSHGICTGLSARRCWRWVESWGEDQCHILEGKTTVISLTGFFCWSALFCTINCQHGRAGWCSNLDAFHGLKMLRWDFFVCK